MAEWYECKVRYDKTNENGLIKPTTETYLVDAISFTDAEERFIDEIEPFISGEFNVQSIKKAKLTELIESKDGNDDRWFRIKIALITLDEKSEKEKKITQIMLVQAQDLRKSIKNLDERMKSTISDYFITSVTETPIMDVFHYTPKDKKPEFPEA